MRKVIISVAPVPGNTISVDPIAIAKDVIESSRAGAAMVHLHVRDKNGALSKDLTVFIETVEAICSESDIVIQGSTGGVSKLTIEERCAPLEYERVETTSLNGGSVNLGDAVYVNSFSDIRYCSEKVVEKGIFPEIEVFEIGMINNMMIIQELVHLERPLLFNIVLGHKGGMQATIEALTCFKQFIPKDALWGITHYGRKDFTLLTAAVAMGASLVRIGFEDSPYLDEEEVAGNNAELVKKMVDIIRSMGLGVATAEEARKIFFKR
jgi:3-keto-5-aminohexanoate cleavage enzyme